MQFNDLFIAPFTPAEMKKRVGDRYWDSFEKTREMASDPEIKFVTKDRLAASPSWLGMILTTMLIETLSTISLALKLNYDTKHGLLTFDDRDFVLYDARNYFALPMGDRAKIGNSIMRDEFSKSGITAFVTWSEALFMPENRKPLRRIIGKYLMGLNGGDRVALLECGRKYTSGEHGAKGIMVFKIVDNDIDIDASPRPVFTDVSSDDDILPIAPPKN